MSQTDQLAGKGAVVAVERIVVWTFFVSACVAGLFTLVFGVAGTITSLAADSTPLILALDHPLPAAADRG